MFGSRSSSLKKPLSLGARAALRVLALPRCSPGVVHYSQVSLRSGIVSKQPFPASNWLSGARFSSNSARSVVLAKPSVSNNRSVVLVAAALMCASNFFHYSSSIFSNAGFV